MPGLRVLGSHWVVGALPQSLQVEPLLVLGSAKLKERAFLMFVSAEG